MRVKSFFQNSYGKSAQKIVEAYIGGRDPLTAIKKYRDRRCRRSVKENHDALKLELIENQGIVIRERIFAGFLARLFL